MSLKQIILFIFLTLVLIVLSYELLDTIERHLGYILIIFLSSLIVGDILLMSRFFFRIMKSSVKNKE